MLWDDFINSYWRNWRTSDRSGDRDRLEDPEWTEAWLRRHRLEAPLPPNEQELRKLQELRSRLFDTVRQLADGHPLDPLVTAGINVYMAKGAVTRTLETSEDGTLSLVLQPAEQSWVQVMAEIAASFAEALLKEPSRFRVCDNPDCLWVYYDDTRNRSKRYCDDKACGNLMKVRRHRARKKAERE